MELMATPVLRGLCSYASLKDGTLSVADVARMNDWIVWDADNKAIAEEK